MNKQKRVYVCSHCASSSPKWVGQCGTCGAWNTLAEEIQHAAPAKPSHPRFSGFAGMPKDHAEPMRLPDVVLHATSRITTKSSELDRVLGGGLVTGSVVLLGGDPGIGKSTLLLQTLCQLADLHKALYVTGEESLQQVTLRAGRMGFSQAGLHVLAETQVERILEVARREQPAIMVIDSIQTAYTVLLQSAPGGVSQVRESTAQLVQFAKQTGMILLLIGHVTKEGNLAGPRILEHMVDTVLYFEGERDSRWRLIRAVKNRFGALNELGIFAMMDRGLREVNNPSSLFLSRGADPVPGSVVMSTWGGSRPLLLEVQALVDETRAANPRRIALGLEANRLNMLLAVLHRHGGVVTYDRDIFVNVVGGMRITETASDLALLFAILSSLRDLCLPQDLIVFGEVGLAGEIRPVQNGQERLREAAKHGFKRAIVPKANISKSLTIADFEICPANNLTEALSYIH